ncbi:MAG: hypothetical protein HYU52_15220 [Acidobacteria bacterium]|nr:hypothetical protein [Acidobacteriota bacterium]
MNRRVTVVLLLALTLPLPLHAAKPPAKTVKPERVSGAFDAESFSGLKFRSIGPAVASGRVSDIAIDPKHPATIFVAVASGGVWKTTNKGTTWTPVFDKQGSYSIGCVTLDPNDPLVVWVGSGENNSQRSVGYGDGVYKSVDGGKSWENVGLKLSEHIGRTSSTSPRRARSGHLAASAGSTRRPMAAGAGSRCLRSARTRASAMSSSTLAIPMSFTRRPISAGATSGH